MYQLFLVLVKRIMFYGCIFQFPDIWGVFFRKRAQLLHSAEVLNRL